MQAVREDSLSELEASLLANLERSCERLLATPRHARIRRWYWRGSVRRWNQLLLDLHTLKART